MGADSAPPPPKKNIYIYQAKIGNTRSQDEEGGGEEAESAHSRPSAIDASASIASSIVFFFFTSLTRCQTGKTRYADGQLGQTIVLAIKDPKTRPLPSCSVECNAETQ